MLLQKYLPILFMGIFLGLVYPSGFAQDLQWDIIGDSHYSQYNFTNLTLPYQGIDSWVDSKITYWLDGNKKLGIYGSTLGSYMFYAFKPQNAQPFDWQRYLQASVGIQVHPFFKDKPVGSEIFLNGIRIFTQFSYRLYILQSQRCSNPFNNCNINTNWQIGTDYYYDNIFNGAPSSLGWVIWSNASFHSTNFSTKDFNTLMWMGNIKGGLKLNPGMQTWLFYVTTDWTYTEQCPCRWWERYIRGGLGIRWYPATHTNTNGSSKPTKGFWRRFHIYAEGLYNLAWLTNHNIPSPVKRYDFRIGIGFSTPGFVRGQEE